MLVGIDGLDTKGYKGDGLNETALFVTLVDGKFEAVAGIGLIVM